MIRSQFRFALGLGFILFLMFCFGIEVGAAAHEQPAPTLVDVDDHLEQAREDLREDPAPSEHPVVPDELEEPIDVQLLPDPAHEAVQSATDGMVLGLMRAGLHIANGGIVVGYTLSQWIPGVLVEWAAMGVMYLSLGGFLAWQVLRLRGIATEVIK